MVKKNMHNKIRESLDTDGGICMWVHNQKFGISISIKINQLSLILFCQCT